MVKIISVIELLFPFVIHLGAIINDQYNKGLQLRLSTILLIEL